jgi:hypothetical protein
LHPLDYGDHLSAWNYYKREADAYRSGWLDDLPGGMAAPRHFGIVEHPDGTCWIWLQDVTDDIGAQWPLEHYGVVARHVGQLNGVYLAAEHQPFWPWLSSGWLRQYVAQSAPAMTPLRESLDHPLVRRWLPGDASERVVELIAVGDVMPCRGVAGEPRPFAAAASWLRTADLTLGNLECVIAEGGLPGPALIACAPRPRLWLRCARPVSTC